MNLQLALALIGIVIVAIVALTAYDKNRIAAHIRRLRPKPVPDDARWVERRVDPVVSLDVNPSPPIENDQKFLTVEAPVGTTEVASEAPPPAKIPDEIETALREIEVVAHQPLNLNPGFDPPGTGPAAAAQAPGRPIAVDERIDFVIHLPGPGPVQRRVALGVYKQNEYQLERRSQLYGQRYRTQFWSTLAHDSDATQYDEIKLAMMLIDSRGPVSESDLNNFIQVGLKLADVLNRPTRFSMPFEDALRLARELQKFVDSYDVVAAIQIATKGEEPFNGEAIPKVAGQFGLQLGATNIFHKKVDESPGCRHLFSMSSAYKPGTFDPDRWATFRTQGLTLFMTVPCAHEPAGVFDQLVDCARGLCIALDGRLLDQKRQPLTESGIKAIRAQIEDIDRKMRAFGVVPGSESALRLFDAPTET